jgi:type I restriction enzyme S subunit
MSSLADKLPDGWVKTDIGNLVELAQGVAINAKTNHVLSDRENGIPLLKINNLLNNTIDQYANPDLVPKQSIIHVNDVIFTRTGQVGEVLTNKYGILHNNSFKVIPSDKLHFKYLYWYLKNKKVYNYVQKVAAGSAQPDLNHGAFKTIEFNYPINIQEQKAIAKVLTAFDDKIENLQAQNKTLEQTAQTIFKEWFGKYQIGDVLPEGWRVGKLGEVTTISAGGDKPKNSTKDQTKKNTIPIYSNGITNDGLYGFTDNPKIIEESVTVSARGTIGFVCLRFEPYVPIVRLISVLPIKKYLSSKYLFYWLNNENIKGSGTTQQQLTVPVFKSTEIIIPNSDIMIEFTKIVDSFYKKINLHKAVILTLSKTRDSLLPKLMSGQLRVNGFKK